MIRTHRISSVWNTPLADEQAVPLLEGVARCVCIWGTSGLNRGIIVTMGTMWSKRAEPWVLVLVSKVAGPSREAFRMTRWL